MGVTQMLKPVNCANMGCAMTVACERRSPIEFFLGIDGDDKARTAEIKIDKLNRLRINGIQISSCPRSLAHDYSPL